MKSKKTSLFKKSIFLTLILFLALILGWQVSADAKTVIFGDNTGDDFPGTVEDALIWQRSGEVNYNYGSKTTNPVGERGTLGKTRRSLIRFKDIASNIGAGKSIISATMYLYCNGEDSDTDHSISAYRVLKDWVEGTQDGLIEDGSSCWNYAQHTGLPWISAGCSVASDVTGEDSTADRRATAEDSTLITGTGWFSWDLTTAVQNWYSGGWSEYGVILINDDEDTPNCRKIFLSSENATDGQLPYLEVTYTVLSVYPPTLDWTGDTGYTTDGVEPDTGDSGSTFEFRVEYTDQDNDAPTIREVWIDLDDSGTYEYAEKFPMTRLAGTDYTQGVDYTKSKTIGYVGDGILNYSFYFNDGTDDAIEYDPVSDHTFTVTTERIIDESFEGNGDGYEETWTPTVGDGCTLNPDYLHSDIPGTPTPPSGAGSECLKLVSESTGWEAYATRDYGLEEPKTFTRMYLYVDDEDLIDGNNKRIALAEDGSGGNVFMLDLNKNGTNLRLRLRLYNDGGWSNYPRKISLDTWYRVEVKYDYDGKSWEWRIDGVR